MLYNHLEIAAMLEVWRWPIVLILVSQNLLFQWKLDSVRSSVCSLLNTAGLLFKVCLDTASQGVEVVAFLQIFIFWSFSSVYKQKHRPYKHDLKSGIPIYFWNIIWVCDFTLGSIPFP